MKWPNCPSFYIKMRVLLTGASWRADLVVPNKNSPNLRHQQLIFVIFLVCGLLDFGEGYPFVLTLSLHNTIFKGYSKVLVFMPP